MKKSILAISVAAAFSSAANAGLPPKVQLSVDQGVKFTTTYVSGRGQTFVTDYTQGSWFSMDADNNGAVVAGEVTEIGGFNGVTVDGVTTQAATGSHGGAPGCTFDAAACSVGFVPAVVDDPATTSIDETAAAIPGVNFTEAPDIDNPWLFFSNTGMHQTTSAISLVSDTGAGDVTLDFSGWSVAWNGIPSIPMGGDAVNYDPALNTGIADMTCYTSITYGVDGFGVPTKTLGAITDCANGVAYILDHKAHVPLGDPSGFGGVPYVVHLEGIVSDTNQAPTAISNPLGTSVVPGGSVRIDAVGNTTDSDGTIDITSVTRAYPDADGRTATVEVCTAASAPHALCQGEGDIIYTDNVGTITTTSDSFTYNLTDNLGKPLAADVTVNIDVITGNLPPSCGNNAPVTTNKNTAININVAINATDPDNSGGTGIDTNTVVTSAAVNGVPGVPTAAGFVNFVPSTGVTGTASFDYTVDDSDPTTPLTCNPAGTINIIINDPPVANDDSANVNRNSVGVFIKLPANDTDSDGTLNLTSVQIVTGASNGSTTVESDGTVTYIPANGYAGGDSFTYTIDDDFGATSNVATVLISVNNALPVAVNDSAAIDISTSATSVDIDVPANDTDSDGTIDTMSVIITGAATNGGTLINPTTGVVTYTPDAGFIGSDSFTYSIKDNDGDTSNVATAAIIVSDSNIVGLPDNAYLSINSGNTDGNTVAEPADGNGSWFHMEVKPGQLTFVSLSGFNGMQIGPGNSQLASVAAPNLDSPWAFFGQLGVHQTTSDVLNLTDDGAGTVTLDLSGWNVSWNSIPSIPLNERAHTPGFIDGVGQMSCLVDCAIGDTYILEYSATVPAGDPSNFGNVKYFVHLEGTITSGLPTFGGGDPNAPIDITEISATDENGTVVVVLPGSTADSVGNTSGINLTPDNIGLKDPQLNTKDGQQCIGGCIDFVITDVTGNYVELVFKLNEVLPAGAIYRKLMNGIWQDFDQSSGGQIGSALSVAGACQQPEGIFFSGLREGSDCIFMRIYDNGPNDTDDAVGTIADPSGALLAGSPNTPAGSSSGCSISKTPVTLIERADWLFVAGFIALMGLISFKRRRQDR